MTRSIQRQKIALAIRKCRQQRDEAKRIAREAIEVEHAELADTADRVACEAAAQAKAMRSLARSIGIAMCGDAAARRDARRAVRRIASVFA